MGGLPSYQSNIETYRTEKQRINSDKQSAYDDISKHCSTLTAEQSIGHCISQELRIYLDQLSTDKDLQAQQDMAFWTFWMFVVSAAGLVISSGGLAIVILSLRQTRQAITNDRELGEAQVRPYIAVAIEHDGICNLDHVPEFYFRMDNLGQSPAYDVRHIALAGFFPRILPVPCNDLLMPDKNSHNVASNLFPKDDVKGSVDNKFTWSQIFQTANDDKNKAFCISGIICYRDVFRREHKRRFCFSVERVSDDNVTAPDGKKVVVAFNFTMANSHNDET